MFKEILKMSEILHNIAYYVVLCKIFLMIVFCQYVCKSSSDAFLCVVPDSFYYFAKKYLIKIFKKLSKPKF